MASSNSKFTFPPVDDIFRPEHPHDIHNFGLHLVNLYFKNIKAWLVTQLESQPEDPRELQKFLQGLMDYIIDEMNRAGSHAYVRYYHTAYGEFPDIYAFCDEIHRTTHDIEPHHESNHYWSIKSQMPVDWPEELADNNLQCRILDDVYEYIKYTNQNLYLIFFELIRTCK